MRLADNELEAFNEVLEQMLGSIAPGKSGEDAMMNWFRRKKGWQIVPHASVRQPGPDAVAWRQQPDGSLLLLLIDNKEFGAPRAISAAPGLTDWSLVRSIGPIIIGLRYMERKRPHVEAAAKLLEDTWLRIVRDRTVGPTKLPPGVVRVLTNGRGKSTGITDTLDKRGYLFLDIAGKAGGIPAAVAARLGLAGAAVP